MFRKRHHAGPGVSKLTLNPARKRLIDARLFAAAVAVSCSGALLAASQPAAVPAWQSTDSIRQAAAAFMHERLPGTADGTHVQPGLLDARLRLSQCSGELEGFLRPGTRIAARTVVGVRCAGEQPWKVYVPVDLVVTKRVFVTARSLPKGHVITAADLVSDTRDVSRAHRGYFSDASQLIGQVVRQTLAAGRVVAPGMIEADLLVRRGQSVTLSVNSGGIDIKMSGKALNDGGLNDRISVENQTSGRVVEGIVRSREHIEVLVAASGGN